MTESKKRKVTARVLSQKEIAPGIYDMRLVTDLAFAAHAGQFIGIYPKNKSTLLPRPISICEIEKCSAEEGEFKCRSREAGVLRLVYRTAGKGTQEFSGYVPLEKAEILGILGNGFPIEEAKGKKIVLMGGGIGIPPMVELAKELFMAGEKVTIIAGYRDNQLFLKEELEKYGEVFVATEDGSFGIKGNVLTVMEEKKLCAEIVMACGPMPMLCAIKQYAEKEGIKAFISLEERMACGVGACLGCVCKTKKADAHSHVHNARICTEGPVFDAAEVDIC